ncbi:ATP-binding cassette domain-containing protein [Candidatus Poribacteria bacterium]|nr:ATP-binding cassette domain-containing protein [Candidatus Poribacteria bacterium]
MISLRNVNFGYDDTLILKNITLDIPDGEVTAILGESGSGKTTLLRLLVGLASPTSGEIYINNRNLMTCSEEVQRQIHDKMSIVFQDGALFDSLTVWENVAFPLYERTGLSFSELRREAEKLLEMVNLREAADLTIDRCSGGMRMRVAIARAFAYYPEIIFYDEPTTALDPIARDRICDLIQKVQFERSVTSVLVTHQLSTAFRVSNRFIFLHKGEVIFEGDVDELMTSKNTYIQRFIKPPSRTYRVMKP